MPDISWIVKEKDGCLIQKMELWDIQYCIKIRGWIFFTTKAKKEIGMLQQLWNSQSWVWIFMKCRFIIDCFSDSNFENNFWCILPDNINILKMWQTEVAEIISLETFYYVIWKWTFIGEWWLYFCNSEFQKKKIKWKKTKKKQWLMICSLLVFNFFKKESLPNLKRYYFPFLNFS